MNESIKIKLVVSHVDNCALGGIVNMSTKVCYTCLGNVYYSLFFDLLLDSSTLLCELHFH